MHEITKNGKLQDGQPLPASGFINSVDENGFPLVTELGQGSEQYNNDYFWLKEKGARSIARGGYWNNGADAGKY
ncbi:MAG: hypothetical protein R6V29_12705, partial [Spirochaetia bacterium]